MGFSYLSFGESVLFLWCHSNLAFVIYHKLFEVCASLSAVLSWPSLLSFPPIDLYVCVCVCGVSLQLSASGWCVEPCIHVVNGVNVQATMVTNLCQVSSQLTSGSVL